ncbi:MAG: 16S rRNA (guanine(966)-N(2))-methyltransferase RsmD [Ruminococcaceae bacterium]|nr:16S rRNA (guanine(966)-N(2))-methyltransferase RsmD [Oscillospiraceae bacterium]
MMRIITGSARGTRLIAPVGEHTRPTAERTKEAIFSMLQFELEGRRVLDLFGGSGQLALEALSRGASRAVILDDSPDAIRAITQNVAKTRLADRAEILKRDALSFLRSYTGAPFHLVFLDPPYALGMIPQCLSLLKVRSMLTAGAVVVCESRSEQDVFAGNDALEAGFLTLKSTRYGVAFVRILQNQSNGEHL